MSESSPQRREYEPARQGEEDWFVRQYRLAYPRLILVAAGILGSREQAEDIVQEAVMIAVEKLDQYRPNASFVAWLSSIVKHCAMNHRRRARSRKTFPADPATLGECQALTDVSVEALPFQPGSGKITEAQTAFDDQVLLALNALGEEARCCLLLKTVLDLTYAEIADMMQIPEGTAMSHVHRSKQSMNRALSRATGPVAKPFKAP